MKRLKPDTEFGLRDVYRDTVKVDLSLTDEAVKYLNELCELTNHTLSSVVTVILGAHILTYKKEEECKDKPIANIAKKGKKSTAK